MRSALCVTALIAIVALPAAADDEVRHPFSSSAPLGSIHRVLIDIPAGDVTVRNSSGRTLAISGDATRNFSERGNRVRQQSIINDVSAVITLNGDEAIVERKFGPNAGSWSTRSFRTEFRIEVDVPSDAEVELTTRYGDVSIEGRFENVQADLHAGEIRLRMPRDSVRDVSASVGVGDLHTDYGDGSGDDNEGVFPHSSHFHNSSGRARVNVHTTAGDVHVLLTR